MKKLFLPLLLAVSLLLGGCGNKNEARFRSFAEELNARTGLTVTAEVRAEFDDRSCSFTLRCAEDGKGGFGVEVLEPELIRGVKARVSADGAKLVYDGVAVDTGGGEASLSPMGALPLLLRTLRAGTLDAAWTEDGCTAVRLVPEDGVAVTVLFDTDMKPSYAEVERDGRGVLFITVTASDF